MLSPMFDTLEEDPMFGGGPARRCIAPAVEEYGNILAKTGGVGLAEASTRVAQLQETKIDRPQQGRT